MQTDKLKKLAINTMIGSLIGAAAIAVIAVLAGEFNDILGKALFTLLIVAVHAIVSLGFLDNKDKSQDDSGLKIFTNTIFILIVLSFVTAVFGIWELFPGSLVSRLYGTYFIAAFAAFHGEMLHKTTGLDTKINNIVKANYVLMGLVIILLLPIIWAPVGTVFPDFYYRLLAAAAIVDATLTILAMILHKLYFRNHPELKSQLFTQVVYTEDANGNKVPQTVGSSRRGVHPFLIILGIFLLLQFIVPIIFLVGGFF